MAWATLCVLTMLAAAAQAEPAASVPLPAVDTATAQGPVLPALTPVRIEILETMNSSTSKIGAYFPIRLAEPINLPGGAHVPAGISGAGQVVHAEKSRLAGRAGELILAVRYLDLEGLRIPLRSLTYGAGRGQDNSDTAAVVGIAGGAVGSVLSLFITGGEVNIPAGTRANAKTSASVTLAAPPYATTSTVIGDSKP
jgi:hypothetical protein